MTHRSVSGRRAPLLGDGGGGGKEIRKAHVFSFGHQDVFPAPADSSSWRATSATSRVFEVWGSSAEALDGGGSGGSGGQAETLLGLAKVSLRPFATFDGGGRGFPKLAVASDGPVVVSDPFTGRAVGDLRLFLALGAPSTIAALSGGSTAAAGGAAPSPSEGHGDAKGKQGDIADRVGVAAIATGAAASGNREENETREEEAARGMEGRLGEDVEGGGGDGEDGEDGVGARSTEQEPPALDDSVAGDDLRK